MNSFLKQFSFDKVTCTVNQYFPNVLAGKNSIIVIVFSLTFVPIKTGELVKLAWYG